MRPNSTNRRWIVWSALLLLTGGPSDGWAQEIVETGDRTADRERGSWGPVLELPTHPEQMAVLPSGKVLIWSWAPSAP